MIIRPENSCGCFWKNAFDKAQNKAQNKAQKSMMTNREHILLLLKENPSLTQAELSGMMNKSELDLKRRDHGLLNSVV